MGFSLRKPWRSLPEKVRQAVLYGTENELNFAFVGERSRWEYRGRFEGLIPNLERRHRETSSADTRSEIERYMSMRPCAACGGKRLRREALAVRVADRTIHDVVQLPVKDAVRWFGALALTPREQTIAAKILKEISDRLGFMASVGLDYLTLARASGTLSGGESQRIRLATQIGSKLMGVLYVLDEPSIGLHQRDNRKLLETLQGMRDLGNTVLVVEHDEETMREADWIVDLGLGRRRARRRGRRPGTAGQDHRLEALPHRSLPRRHADDRRACRAARRQRPAARRPRRPRAQPQGDRRRLPARHLHLRDRRLRVGQVDARQRDPLQGVRPLAVPRPRPPGSPHPRRGGRVHRQGRGHRPGPDRTHATLQPGHLHQGVRPDPRAVRDDPRGALARLQARPLLVQRPRRAL